MLITKDIQKLAELLATKNNITSIKEDLSDLKLTASTLILATDEIMAHLKRLNDNHAK